MVAIGNRKMICTREELLDLINTFSNKTITPIGEITDIYINGWSVIWYNYDVDFLMNAKTYIITVNAFNEAVAESLTLVYGIDVPKNIEETIEDLVDAACEIDYITITKSELENNKYAIAKAMVYYTTNDVDCIADNFDKTVNEINKSLSANCKNLRIEYVFHGLINEYGEYCCDSGFNIVPTE